MNPLIAIRWGIGIALVCALLLGALAIRNLRAENGRLQTRLTESRQQLDSANLTIDSQGQHIATLLQLNSDVGADLAALQDRLETIHRNATARAVKLETVTHENQDAKAWGDVLLPGSVAGVLDYTQDTTTAAPADRASLPASDAVPAAEDRTEDQPATGAEPDREPPGA